VQIGLSSLAWDKWNFLRKPKLKSDSYFGVKRNLDPKRGGKQGELAGHAQALSASQRVGW